jgi:ribosomal protein S18 acetylase RimI-like enzyme
MPTVNVMRTYLQMTGPDDLPSAATPDPNVSLWLLSSHGSPAGYFELKRHDDDSVEIASFGLLREFTGRGWGKYLLTRATRAA